MARIHKRTVQEYTKELYNKVLNDPCNHSGMVTHLEPDILECEDKWTLGSTTTNRPSGGDGIPAERFLTLKKKVKNKKIPINLVCEDATYYGFAC